MTASALPRNQSPPLRRFIQSFTALIDTTHDEALLLKGGTRLLAALVARDNWLPLAFAQPDPDRYCQYLLYCDPGQRFSIVSFVWSAGQSTPIHDHRVWGLVGVLRGSERVTQYEWGKDASLYVRAGRTLATGEVDSFRPATGDIHSVANADAATSVSIHVYGADIGRVERATFTPDGTARSFVSGYAEAPPPLFLRMSAP